MQIKMVKTKKEDKDDSITQQSIFKPCSEQ